MRKKRRSQSELVLTTDPDAELEERDRDPKLYRAALAGIEELRQDAPRRWTREGALEWELLWLADL